MLCYKDYELIYDCDNSYLIGYKKEIVRYLKDNIKNYIDQNFPLDILEEELERLTIVRDCKWEEGDLIRVENNDEGKHHNPKEKIAKVKVLVPYGNGFSGKDVCKYLV